VNPDKSVAFDAFSSYSAGGALLRHRRHTWTGELMIEKKQGDWEGRNDQWALFFLGLEIHHGTQAVSKQSSWKRATLEHPVVARR
jgi:hypothetical protein